MLLDAWLLSTNAPIQLVMDESPFLVSENIFCVFRHDEVLGNDLAPICIDKTVGVHDCLAGGLSGHPP
jgi:hypothetical protein